MKRVRIDPFQVMSFAVGIALAALAIAYGMGCASPNGPTPEETQLEEQQHAEPDVGVVTNTITCKHGEQVRAHILDVLDNDRVVYDGMLACDLVESFTKGHQMFKAVFGKDALPRLYRLERVEDPTPTAPPSP